MGSSRVLFPPSDIVAFLVVLKSDYSYVHCLKWSNRVADE